MHHGDTERHDDAGDVTLAHHEVQQAPLQQVADDEHDHHGDGDGVERVEVERVDDHEGDVRREDGQVAVSEVGQPHGAEHQREADREQRVEAAEEDALDSCV